VAARDCCGRSKSGCDFAQRTVGVLYLPSAAGWWLQLPRRRGAISMQRVRRDSTVLKLVCILLSAILIPCGVSLAQGARGAAVTPTITSCAVLPLSNLTGHDDPMLPSMGAAAVSIALQESRELVVTSTTDLERETRALGIVLPASKSELVRLGTALRVDKVLTGKITELSVNSGNGQARCSLEISMLDVDVQEVLDGAIATVTTPAIPGWTGDVTKVVNDALRSASTNAVTQMLAKRIRRGHVDLITDKGEVNINLGIADGVEIGTELLVMRPTWSSDLERTLMRRVGTIVVGEVHAHMGWARVIDGSTPQTGDRVYKLHVPPVRQKEIARSASRKKSGQLLAAAGILLGIYNAGTSSTSATPSELTGNLSQVGMGQPPTVVLKVHTSNTEMERTRGWVIYRAANNPYFPTQPMYIIDVIEGRKLPGGGYYSDDPNARYAVDGGEFTFDYAGEEGEREDADVEFSYNHLPMVQGMRYYYVVRRIIEPLMPPGYNPPIATAQVDDFEPVDEPELTIDVEFGQALSDPSNHFGPITYYTVPQLVSPVNRAPNQLQTNIAFTWQVSEGADLYRVELYDERDPSGRGNPYWVSPELRVGAGQREMSYSFNVPSAADGLAASSTYYWRVGARASGDVTLPVCRDLQDRAGFLYSEMRQFQTVMGPPSPLQAGDDAKPAGRKPGFFGSVRRGSVGR
jgi:hypothetical protein